MERHRILLELIVNAVVRIVYHRRDIIASHLPILVRHVLLQLVRLPMERHRIRLERIVNAVVQIVYHRRDIIALNLLVPVHHVLQQPVLIQMA